MSSYNSFCGTLSQCAFRHLSFSLAATVIAIFLAASPASAENLVVDFSALPVSANTAEFVWTGGKTAELYSGPGSLGTGYPIGYQGDGERDVSLQNAGGLLVQSSNVVNSIKGSTVTGDSTTAFYDCTLLLQGSGLIGGIAADGTASTYSVTVGKKTNYYVYQGLENATFSIYSTDPADSIENNYTLLLAGNISDMTLAGKMGTSSGWIEGLVTFTDGAILDATGYTSLSGDFSWALSLIGSTFSVDSSGSISTFNANALGTFTVAVPEPGTFVLLGLGGIGLSFWAWRRRRSARAAA